MDPREMIKNGWTPVCSKNVSGRVDADGRPIVIWFWMKTSR